MSLHPKSFAEALRKKGEAKARKVKRMLRRRQLLKAKPIQAMRATLIARLDELWAQIIKLSGMALHGPLCRLGCGRRADTACHKVPKQRGFAVRWRLDNGYFGCHQCNLGEMMNRALYRDKHISAFGREQIEKIEEAARAKVKFSPADLADKVKGFEALLAEGLKSGWGSIPVVQMIAHWRD